MKREEAKSLLAHYFWLSSTGSWNYDSDSRSEIDACVDLIIESAVEEVLERLKTKKLN